MGRIAMPPIAMPRFVVLRHDSPRGLHWDLLLEVGPVMKTWDLPQTPDLETAMGCDALFDHRLAFLDFQGQLSAGQGSVIRWDRGTYQTLAHDQHRWTLLIAGKRLVGRVLLRHLDADRNINRWEYRFEAAPSAND